MRFTIKDLLLGTAMIAGGIAGLCALHAGKVQDFTLTLLAALAFPALLCAGVGALFRRAGWGLLVGLVLGSLLDAFLVYLLSTIRC